MELTLQVATEPGFTTPLLQRGFVAPAGTIGTTATTAGPFPPGTYVWRTSWTREQCGLWNPVPSAPLSFKVVARPPAPTASSPPTITGTTVEGGLLSAGGGSWLGAEPITLGYEWSRCDNSGAACTAIPFATNSSYTATQFDIGRTLRVAVRATNIGGTTTALSSPTQVVLARAPTNTALPAVSGLAQEGQQLTATQGSWSSSVAPILVDWQWLRCQPSGDPCAEVTGVTGSTYIIATSDVGSTIRARANAHTGGGTTSAVSPPTAVVVALPTPQPPATPPPTASKKCIVPNVRGKTVARATTAVASARCALGPITRKFSTKTQRGRVLAQTPSPGTRLPVGGRVRLTVGRGLRAR